MAARKPIEFRGTPLTALRQFPLAARREAGFQLGLDPDDWKPMNDIGAGVREIRVDEKAGAFRVLYVAKFRDVIYVLHCFQKKSRKTSQADVVLGKARYNHLLKALKI